MKAKKLPSGNWNVRAFSHYETDKSGKKKQVFVSFTASTKAEAMRQAAEFMDGKRMASQPQNMTVMQCLEMYIRNKQNVLSPSTLRSYSQMKGKYFTTLGAFQIGRLSTAEVQLFVSTLAASYSPKTVRNVYGFFSAAVEMVAGRHFKVTLPAKIPPTYDIPTDAEVNQMIELADPQLKMCIVLSSMGTLRRGEICGLKYKDVLRDFNAVYVHTDMVQDTEGSWIHKEIPKNSNSIRRVDLPQKVMDLIGDGDPDELIYKGTPDSMTGRFRRLVKKCGLKCRFHDLRHYSASIMHAIGVPDSYIMERGGWKSDVTLKSVYRNTLSDKTREFTSLTNAYFQKNLLSADAADEEQKPDPGANNINHDNISPEKSSKRRKKAG